MSYSCVTTLKDIKAYLAGAALVAFDFETSPTKEYRDVERAALDAHKAEITGVSFSVAEGSAIYIPLRHRTGKNANPATVMRHLRGAVFENRQVIKIAHNLAFEAAFLYALGVVVQPPVYDTIAASQLTLKNHIEFRNLSDSGLKTLVPALFGVELPDFETVTEGRSFDELPAQDAETVRYACADSDYALRLYHRFNAWFDKSLPRHRFIAEELESPTAVYCGLMRYNGLLMDRETMLEKQAEAETKLAEIRAGIAGYVGDVEIGANASTSAFKSYLYNTLGLPVVKTTAKYQEAADDEAMVLLADWCREHKPELVPLFELIQEYRRWGKLKGTYLDGYLRFINEATGRIHPDLLPLGTETGRFASRNPNMHLTASNDGSFFTNLGKRLVIGGWINPTTYSIGNTYCPLVSTRNGPGQPLFYLSLYQGRYRVMLYNSSGSLIHDRSEPTMQIPFQNGGWYFIATIIDIEASTVQSFVGNRADGATWKTSVQPFTGTLNPACTANIVFGMLQTTYWYAGGLDDWFFETDSALTIDDLERHFLNAQMANGASSSADVDAWTEPGVVTLKATNGVYPNSGALYTRAVECNLAGTGRVSVTSEYTAGVTSIASVETSTSDDMVNWTAWQLVDASGALQSPNNEYIRFRVTLATTDTSRTPRLIEIQLHDIPVAPYEKLGFARPIVLDAGGAWEAVLENAYDIVVTDEINGSDTLEFKLPFRDPKRTYLDNEKQVQVAGAIYRIRTLTDDKSGDGRVVTQVYAEAAFYDLAFTVKKEPQEYNAETAEAPMQYALLGTGWSIGMITVTTRRTWSCSETSALAILRAVADIHGGDLVFDSVNREVSLLTFSGKDSGALFSYRKNMKSIKRVVDTRSLVTRLYAYGKDGITFASINDGKPYVEDYTYSADVRISTLDLSSFTNPYQMLEFTQMRLAEYAKPRVSYVLSAMDLSVLTGYEHEAWDLGDTVLVHDRELNLTIRTRVIRRQYNVQEPWKTVIELSTKLRELGDSTAAWDKAADTLSQVDVLDRQEIKDMVPFNHLLNSRADNGLAYWLNSGFEVDTGNGVSGTACFKAVGVSGMTKSLSQTVYPANRKSYTFSAQIASEDLKKGPNGQVGIQVIFEYEDGSTETRFIDLF